MRRQDQKPARENPPARGEANGLQECPETANANEAANVDSNADRTRRAASWSSPGLGPRPPGLSRVHACARSAKTAPHLQEQDVSDAETVFPIRPATTCQEHAPTVPRCRYRKFPWRPCDLGPTARRSPPRGKDARRVQDKRGREQSRVPSRGRARRDATTSINPANTIRAPIGRGHPQRDSLDRPSRQGLRPARRLRSVNPRSGGMCCDAGSIPTRRSTPRTRGAEELDGEAPLLDPRTGDTTVSWYASGGHLRTAATWPDGTHAPAIASDSDPHVTLGDD